MAVARVSSSVGMPMSMAVCVSMVVCVCVMIAMRMTMTGSRLFVRLLGVFVVRRFVAMFVTLAMDRAYKVY